jgi:PPOX class probable F420-dependent enzyme
MHHSAMAAGTELTQAELDFLAAARTAVLGTTAPDGRPRLVPICFAHGGTEIPIRIYTPLDEKPKRAPDPHDLARVRDIMANPLVSLIVDRWSEDWTALGWLRIDGRADLVEPGDTRSLEHPSAVASLRLKYPQYADHRLEARPLIRVVVERARSWGNLGV